MSLFQKTIITKFLNSQNQETINQKWDLFCSHFHNSEIQENIRNSKEEQYQGEFLIDLFVQVLGYTKNPTPNFNLTTEYKNVKDSKKADGAIIINDKVVAIIELKGTDTTDLGKVENQAFGYKNNQPNCKYVITSNFEKLRFYIDNAIEHLEFNLFELTREQFELLYLCLAYENILADIPSKIKNESVSKEDEITKKLYKDYSVFKRELFQNLTQQNPEFDQLELFKKSQKLLDRLLFLFFGEDRGLLPINFTRGILSDWQKLKELDAYMPLYNRFKQNFGYIDNGDKDGVFPYNGGLFKPDEILDNVIIEDDLLYYHTFKLAEYDFSSDVDVNILGHIFENSLNEIDEIKAQLEGQEIDKSKTKRKKDGVFYTPKYITKYIVENTVGKLCEEKKAEIGIVEEEYFTDRKRQLKTKQVLLQKLENYRNWLHQITIIDPACGSGAFLNEALNFLIEEHKYIDELDAKLDKKYGTYGLEFNIENSILENNLFGVDLNEESVEIAKLSLWLRTAKKDRKLNDLSNNIKCGNSLIDDPAIAGDKAFNWEKEFPQVFKEKKAYHLVFTTHNSRISQRMKMLGIVPGKPAELTLPQEIQLAEIFSEIVKKYSLEILSWNICKDHIHLILVCTEDELYDQVRLMKSISSKLLNRWMTIPMGLDPLPDNSARLREALEEADSYIPEEHNNHLWSQKFYSVDTESWKWISEEESGFPYAATHLSNAMEYIKYNRDKHQLPKSEELEQIISGFIKTPEEVFKNNYKGGFDVVIGNPPYVRVQNLDYKSIDYFKKNKKTAFKRVDISTLFFELSYDLINKNGILGFITSNQFQTTEYGHEIRSYINEYFNIYKIIDFGDLPVFEGALTYVSIYFFDKSLKKNFLYSKITDLSNLDFSQNQIEVNRNQLKEDKWIFTSDNIAQLISKLNQNPKLLNFGKSWAGLFTGKDEIMMFNHNEMISSQIEKEIFMPVLRAEDMGRYVEVTPANYVIYPYKVSGNKTVVLTEEELQNGFPKAYDYLIKNKTELMARKDSRKTFGDRADWFALTRFGTKDTFCKDKIVSPGEVKEHKFSIDYSKSGFSCARVFAITTDDLDLQYLLVILNSSLAKFYLQRNSSVKAGGYFSYSSNVLNSLPIKICSEEEQQNLIKKGNFMFSLNKELQDIVQKFQRSIQRELFSPRLLEALPKKLQNWHELSFADFLKQIEKSKGSRTLGLSEKAEWEDYFLAEQKKALDCQSKIQTTDKEIDQMVYQLYGLTEEEIEIVEKG